MAYKRGCRAELSRWAGVRDEIYQRMINEFWDDERGAFMQTTVPTPGRPSLLMPLVKFVAPKDPRWLSTLDAIEEGLVSDTLVYRYNTKALTGRPHGEEGTFSMCSFWYVEALARSAISTARSLSRRAHATPTISAFTPRRSGCAASSWATSPRPSPISP